jgi:hypothetical protein
VRLDVLRDVSDSWRQLMLARLSPASNPVTLISRFTPEPASQQPESVWRLKRDSLAKTRRGAQRDRDAQTGRIDSKIDELGTLRAKVGYTNCA